MIRTSYGVRFFVRAYARSTRCQLSQNALYYNQPDRVNQTPINIAKITAADVQRVAKQYLVKTSRTVVITTPKPAAAPKGGVQ